MIATSFISFSFCDSASSKAKASTSRCTTCYFRCPSPTEVVYGEARRPKAGQVGQRDISNACNACIMHVAEAQLGQWMRSGEVCELCYGSCIHDVV